MSIVRVLFLVMMLLSAGLVYWTQTLARTYGYHPALGPALWEMQYWPGRVYPLYAPWQALIWQWYWGERWVTWVVLGSLGLGLGLVLVGCWWWLHREPRGAPPPMEGHGTTRWANRRDVKKAGLL